MKKIKFQDKAVDRILEISEKFLYSKRQENKYILLRAITGSGKTVMASKFIKRYLEEHKNTVFVWVTIGTGNLHVQSAKKLENNLPKNFNIILPEGTLSKNSYNSGDILVLNWEAINSTEIDKVSGETIYTNVIMRGGERNSLRKNWERTRENGYDIVLIIDESHYTSTSQTSKEIVKLIKPVFVLELTATPNYTEMAKKGHFEEVTVDVEDVIKEKVIKKSIKLNEMTGENIINKEENSSEISLMMTTAINKREELKHAYEELEIKNINPLCLIQIPNSVEGERVKEEVLDVLKKRNISIEKGNLAIWLSGDTLTDKEKIKLRENNSPVEHLIFKQAVATGWDCPRASILVKLREVGSEIFDIQTIGRILRTPNLEYYKNDILNHAYIYTNSNNYSLETGGYPHVLPQRQEIKEEFKEVLDIILYSEKVGRINNYRREYELGIIFKRMLEGQKLNDDIKNFSRTIKSSVVDTLEMDKHANEKIEQKIITELAYEYTVEDINRFFRRLLFSLKSPIYTTDVLSRLILSYLGERFEGKRWLDIKKIALLNSEIITQAINKIKTEDKELSEFNKETQEFKFNSERFASGKEIVECKKNAYNVHFVSDKTSNPEIVFEKYIEEKDNVEYWIKNGDYGNENFSIVYKELDEDGNETNILSEFYPDYFIKFTDNQIGLFEVKNRPDLKESETKQKIKALKEYIEKYNILGGLVEVENGVVYRLSLHEKLK